MRLCIGIILWLMSTLSNGVLAATAGTSKIDRLYVHATKGIQVISDQQSWSDEECDAAISNGGTGSTRIIVIDAEEPVRQLWMSQILASQAQSKEITVWVSGCSTWGGVEYPKVNGIYTFD